MALRKRLTEKAGDKKICLIKEDSVGYVMLNEKVNVWNPEKIRDYIRILDEVEKDEQIKVMVTISTSPKYFSTGFDLNVLMGDRKLSSPMYMHAQELFGRILSMNCHTIAVTSGHVFAAGLMIAICHDTLLGTTADESGRWSMSELQIGITISEGMADIMKHLKTPKTARTMMWGGRFTADQMLSMEVVSKLYSKEEEVVEIVAKAVDKYGAYKGAATKEAKTNFHRRLLPNLWEPRLTDVTYELNTGMKL